MNRRLRIVTASALATVLTACGGGGGGGGSASAVAPNPGQQSAAGVPSQLLVKNYGQAALNGASYVGSISNATIDATVLVHQQNLQGLVQYAQEVQNPSSANYRSFLTPDEIATRFGATQSDYTNTATYFANNGLLVSGWKQRMLLHVSGTQANMERAFGTKFGLYQKAGVEFVAPMSQPHFTQVLPVDQVGDIVQYHVQHRFMIPSPRAGAGFASGYSPQTIRAAYDYIGAYQAGATGSGVTIGIIATGPIDTTSSGHGDVDLNAFVAATGSNAANVVEVPVTNDAVANGLSKSGNPTFPYSDGFASPPPVTAPCTGALPACNPEDGEAQLDTQQAATLAPSSTVNFYLAYNASDCTGVTYPNPCPSGQGSPMIGITESDPEIQQVINDNVADVISMSFGAGEYDASGQGAGTFSSSSAYQGSFEQAEFAALEVEGIAAFASSGDAGSTECYPSGSNTPVAEQCVTYPAGDPNVTSVGGITTNVNAQGQATAPWLAWGISTSDNGYGGTIGSGGGISQIIDANTAQKNATGQTLREQPDVSLDGDPSTGVATVENAQWGGTISGIGGTSVSSPEMAAMWADVLSACKAHPSSGICPAAKTGPYWRLGNAAPYLYGIYKAGSDTGFTSALTYSQVFYDIVYGDNQMYSGTSQYPASPSPSNPVPGYAAGPGYDEVSGIGVPFAGHLIEAITGLTGIN